MAPRALAPGCRRADGTISLVVGFDDSESARRALSWGANLLRAACGTVEPAGTPVIVTGRPRHSARRIIGSLPVRLMRRSPYPVIAIA